MAEEKKRYWLKLDKDFLKSPQIKVIQKMPNGKDYIILYLSLMLESVETIGHLKLNGLIPYNAEIISAITETNIDIVRSALEVFKSLGMIQYLDDGTIFMVAVPKMTGKESESAERVRRYREKLQQKEIFSLQCNAEVTKCNDNKEKEKEEEKEIIEKINKEEKEIKAIEKLQQYKNPDLMFDKKIDEVFKLYKKKCPNLYPLVYEERNIERRQQVKDLLILCRYDMGYIEGLFNRANEQIFFYEEKMNFQSLIKNHEKIYHGIGGKKPEKKETAETLKEKIAKWEANAKEREARENNDIEL